MQDIKDGGNESDVNKLEKPNNRRTGSKWEEKAAEYMQKDGMRILERNFRCRTGEIDIIAKDGGVYVFTEVKYRSTGRYGMSYEAVTPKKQQIIIKTAQCYMMMHGIPMNTGIRFDVCGFDAGEVTYIKGAF